MTRLQHWCLAALFLAGLSSTVHAQPAEVMNAAELQLALEKLEVVGSALYVAAHPDDENTAMLSWLASGRKVRTAYLSLTRGDGGQNLIGEEIGAALGVIRTNELLAARRVDGAEQFFTRAVDFGYSKGPDETFGNWNRDAILSDVVWVIRTFRPDIIITRFPTDGEGGHGQHTASALLALEAFDAAADPARFPEQLAHVAPWRARRLFWNHWNPAGTEQLVRVDLGEYSPLLGRSFTEIAGESRSQHKSQGFGAAERRGSIINHLRLERGEPAQDDPFGGVDLTWRRIPGGEPLVRRIAQIREKFDPANPAASVPELVRLRKQMRALEHPDAQAKLKELDDIIRSASGLWIEAIAEVSSITRGEALPVKATAIRRGSAPAAVVAVEFLASNGNELAPVTSSTDGALPASLERNAPVTWTLNARVPETAPLSEPFWLRGRASDSREPHYAEPSPSLRGAPTGPPPFAVRFDVRFDEETISFTEPVQRRWVDRVRGELYELTRVAPAVSVAFDEPLLIFPESAARRLLVTVENRQTSAVGDASLTFGVPAGWRVDPSTVSLSLKPRGRSSHELTITPPASGASGELTATLSRNGAAEPAVTVSRIDYEHIPAQLMMSAASAELVRADIRTRGKRIAYIQGSGDEGATALRQIGFDVTELSDEQIGRADLSSFDTIVVGVRALNARESAQTHIARLHDYVRNGGTLLVQYHTADHTLVSDFAPVPLKLGRGRVTVEGSPVTVLDPEHRLLRSPNRISAADFEGWVQERGLYFGETWDAAYETPLAMADPGEEPLAGGLVVAPYGKGHFIYTGYSFFRQIPAGVPGAIRLFANLASAGGDDATR